MSLEQGCALFRLEMTDGLEKTWRSPLPTTAVWQSRISAVWSEAGGRPRILIIDDDIGLSRMVAILLRHQSFDVDVANNGDDGLALLGTQQYDAVVLDMRMPGKDGRAVYREMRAAGVQTPVLVLSAYDAGRASDELGSEAFLDKPFEPDDLVARLKSMLNSRA